LAAIQGVDLEGEQDKGQKQWEDMKARVFSQGQTNDSNDILSFQGPKASSAGFGINMGLDYEDARDPSVML
jgi:opacity protein-like surface antigen